MQTTVAENMKPQTFFFVFLDLPKSLQWVTNHQVLPQNLVSSHLCVQSENTYMEDMFC